MASKIYGYIFVLFFSSSAFGVPLPSEEGNIENSVDSLVETAELPSEEGNIENSADSLVETADPSRESRVSAEEAETPATMPDVSIDRPVNDNNVQEDIVDSQPSVTDEPVRATPVTPAPEKPVVTALCQPVSFLDKGWVSASNHNATDYPVIVDREELILLPDDRYGAATAAVFANTVTPPFEVQFEFSTYDDDGGYLGGQKWHSADGVSFFFLKNGRRYGTPPNGGTMGFSAKGGGLAVGFPTHGSRIVRLSEANGESLTERYFRNAYSHGKWIPVSVTVKADRVTVKSGEITLFSHKLNIKDYQQGNSIGFSAATGDADSRHEVRKVCIRKL